MNSPTMMILANNTTRSMIDLKTEVNIIVDLDAEQQRPNSDGSNSFRLVMRRTKTVNLAVIEAYVKGKTSFSTDVLEGLSKSTSTLIPTFHLLLT